MMRVAALAGGVEIVPEAGIPASQKLYIATRLRDGKRF